MKTSILIPAALCNLLSEKWNSTLLAILINWGNAALYLRSSGQSSYSDTSMISPKGPNGKIRFLKWVQIPQRCFTNGSWVRISQAEMPWPGVVLMKRSKTQKSLGKTPPFTAETLKLGKLILCQWACFLQPPRPPSPSVDSCWSKSLGSALLNSRFHLHQLFPHVPAQKYANWPKYSNQSAPCQTAHLCGWSQAELLFGSNISLFCNKIIRL